MLKMVRSVIPRIPMIPMARCPVCPRAVSAVSHHSSVCQRRSSLALSFATDQLISFLLLSQQWPLGTRHIFPGGHLNCTVKSQDTSPLHRSLSQQSTVSSWVNHLSVAVTNVLKRKQLDGGVFIWSGGCSAVRNMQGRVSRLLEDRKEKLRKGGGHV